MVKNTLILITFILLHNGISLAQNKDWEKPLYDFLGGKTSKLDGNLRYTVDTIMSIEDRNIAINKIKKYIEQNLLLLEETDLEDSVHIVLAKNRNEMSIYTGGPILGIYIPRDQHVPENMIFCIYGPQHDALKHELMHMVSRSKWGGMETYNGRPTWLDEGLAVFANPEAEDCDGYNLEERYVHFLQNDRLFKLDSLFINTKTVSDYKISYTQAGYMTGHLVNKFGIKCLKSLWQSNINDFEKIYGLRLEDIMFELHNNLKLKYPSSVNIDDKYLNRNCIE